MVEQVKLNGGIRKTRTKTAKVLGTKDQRTVEKGIKIIQQVKNSLKVSFLQKKIRLSANMLTNMG